MIRGMNSSLIALENSPFIFHLTGSRAFGTARPNSDHDFFVDNSIGSPVGETIETWLKTNGWSPIGRHESYDDPFIIGCWISSCGGIHVQVVKDAPLKLRIQNCLIKAGILNQRVSRDVAKRIWTTAIAVATELGT